MTSLSLPIKTPRENLNFLSAYFPLKPIRLILIIATVIRVIGLGVGKLWYDETGTVWMASLPFAEMITATGGDVHPPFYLAMMWAWIRVFGTSEFMVRIPSMLFSIGSIYLLYRLALRLGFTRSVATAAAALMAFVPAQLHYSQEARMYALLQFEFLLALLCALNGQWLWLGVINGALMLTQNYGVIFAGLTNIVALVQWRSFPRKWEMLMVWLWGVAITLLMYVPWLGWLRSQLAFVGAGSWWAQTPSFGTVLYVLYMMVWTFSTPEMLQVHAALIVISALLITMARAIYEHNRPALIVLILALVPIMIGVVISMVFRPVLIFRALLPISPLLCLALAWAFTAGTSTNARLAIAILVLPTFLAIVGNYYLSLPTSKGNPQTFMDVIEWQEGDVMYYGDEGPAMMMHFYIPPEWDEYVMPPVAANMGALTATTRNAMGMRTVALDDLRWRRAWLFAASGPTTAARQNEEIESLLEQYTHLQVYERRDNYTHTAIYLLFNRNVAVGMQ
jgi:4-amino-4-deoxy-L-arabinose transferase-like glycosyltransferase